jgi:glycolate oxidase
VNEWDVDALRAVSAGVPVKTDPETLLTHRSDEARAVDAGAPRAVVFPRSTDDVRAVLRFAYERAIPVVARGAGSGLSGGANAIDGCIVLSLVAMNRILAVDVPNQIAVVQPGVITADVDRAAAEFGLWYPPDPASHEFSTIGGNIATNAGGLCCVKYGVTSDFVLGLEVVLVDGSVARLGRKTRKSSAGYDLVRLFVGSEGTLGVVTEATLRLRPRPRDRGTLVASFDTVESAGAAITRIVSTVTPCILELMDRTTIRAVERWKSLGLDDTAEALLLVQSDAPDQDAELGAVEAECRRAGASMVLRSGDPAEAELLMTARRLAYPALERLGDVLLDDVAVPVETIPALLRSVVEIAHQHSVVVGTFGHAGDGNMHPTIVFDRTDESSVTRMWEAFDAIVSRALELGGTITGEHGVGLLKAPYLEREIGSVGAAIHRTIKDALDPKGILNPGKAL